MASDYTDEDLFSRYYAATLDARQAAEMVAVHRESYPLPSVRDTSWDGVGDDMRQHAIMEAARKAAGMADGSEKNALVAHILAGARVEAVAVQKVKR